MKLFELVEKYQKQGMSRERALSAACREAQDYIDSLETELNDVLPPGHI